MGWSIVFNEVNCFSEFIKEHVFIVIPVLKMYTTFMYPLYKKNLRDKYLPFYYTNNASTWLLYRLMPCENV